MHLATQRSWASANTSIVYSVLRALRRAETFVAENPDSSQVIMADEINVELETVKSIWEFYDFSLMMDSQELRSATTLVGQWITESNADYSDKQIPDYSQYYNEEYYSEFAK